MRSPTARFSLDVKLARGGSVDPGGYAFLDVANPEAMKARLDEVSLPNFVAVARGALERSGATLGEVRFVCPLHMKRSMYLMLLERLGLGPDQAEYLDDTGHMSGVDSLFGLDRAAREGRLSDGDLVLLISAGTGYTWAASGCPVGGSSVTIEELHAGLGSGLRRGSRSHSRGSTRSRRRRGTGSRFTSTRSSRPRARSG